MLAEAYRSMGLMKRLIYIFRRFPLRDEAQQALNDTVDYLSNSTDRKVIKTVNDFPFQLTTRTVAVTIATARRLEDMFKENGNEQPGNESIKEDIR